jgi:hypothetical protein
MKPKATAARAAAPASPTESSSAPTAVVAEAPTISPSAATNANDGEVQYEDFSQPPLASNELKIVSFNVAGYAAVLKVRFLI